MAFFSKPAWKETDLTPWVLYLWKLQDPGNLGTLLRTAQATGSFSVVCSEGTVSRFNSKTVRAAAASLFSVPVLEGVDLNRLEELGYRLWDATARSGRSLFELDFESPAAFVIGNEGVGLDLSWQERIPNKLHIPMDASVESLNAGVAGSLILYEVFRRLSSNEWGEPPQADIAQ